MYSCASRLLTCIIGSDNKIFIWNVGMGEVLCEIDFPDIPLSCSWNYDGSRFAVACKDHKLRIVDPRTGQFIRVSMWLVIVVRSSNSSSENARLENGAPEMQGRKMREKQTTLYTCG